MSKIEYTGKDDLVKKRSGEFFEITSCYATPRQIAKVTNAEWHYKADALVFFQLFADVDELNDGKPRRFFDHMLSLIEFMRENDPLAREHTGYWDHMVKGCEMWLSAVENGLYDEVIKLAEPVKKGK